MYDIRDHSDGGAATEPLSDRGLAPAGDPHIRLYVHQDRSHATLGHMMGTNIGHSYHSRLSSLA